jgi:hypothetical protein
MLPKFFALDVMMAGWLIFLLRKPGVELNQSEFAFPVFVGVVLELILRIVFRRLKHRHDDR